MAFRVCAETVLELGKVLGSQGAIFFRDPRDIGPPVIDPYIFGWIALSEENNVGLCSWAVRGERAIGEAKNLVKIAVLGEDLEYIARLIGKQNIVGHDDGGPAARLEDAHHVLDEVELFVAGGNREIIPAWRLVGPFGAKGRIGHNDIKLSAPSRLINGVSEIDVGLDAMKIEVHQSKPSGPGNQFRARIGGSQDAPGILSLQTAAG